MADPKRRYRLVSAGERRRRPHVRRAVSVDAPSQPKSSDAEQVAAIRAVMRIFVEDDVANGVAPHARMYCDACQSARPAAGFIRYDRHELCNGCATEYEVARVAGSVLTAGQYVRDKRFGEADSYSLEALDAE